jgi:outer membrane immunogenic protein
MRYRLVWLFAAMVATPAFAADLPVFKAPPTAPYPAPYNWTGFYVASNLGLGQTNATVTDTFAAPGVGTIGVPVTTSERLRGPIGGFGAGYNWQLDRLVLGVEADVNFSRQRFDDASVCNVGGLLIPTCTVSPVDEVQWFATLRARAGIAIDRWLVYATAGAVVQDLRSYAGVSISGAGSWNVFDVSTTRTGYVVGGGFETALTPNWFVGAEYLYVNTGTGTTVSVPLPATLAQTLGAPPGIAVLEKHSLADNIVRLRAGYRF